MRWPTSDELGERRQRFAEQERRRDKMPWLLDVVLGVVLTVFWAGVALSLGAMAWQVVSR